jgi:exopolysaccharide biosynthesis polyprenyl glycosylphosphotransferase
MASDSIQEARKPDLRSPAIAKLRQGVAITSFRIIALILLDALSIAFAWQLSLFLGTPTTSSWGNDSSFLLLALAIAIGIIATRGLYQAGGNRRNYLWLIQAISLSDLLLLLIAFLNKSQYPISRSTFLLFCFFSLVFISTGRICFDIATNIIRKQGAVRHSAFLISESIHCPRNVSLIEQEGCYNLLGVADSTALDRRNREETFAEIRNLGIEEVFLSWDSIKNRLYVCWYFQTAGITLRILPTELEFALLTTELGVISGVPYHIIRASNIIGSDYWIKRYFDFCCAAAMLILLAPLYVLIAISIKLDSPGEIFFRQNRIGLHGQQFKVWKFRTMIANADKLQAALEEQNEIKDGVTFKMKNDPRITRVGKFLRRYSLDELPQLFNVLLGEMSFVGPRPLPVRDVERFRERHFIRQEVLPGITGLWQVSGRSDIDNFEDAVNLDITYIVNWSLWNDLKILLKTAQVVFQRKGAY